MTNHARVVHCIRLTFKKRPSAHANPCRDSPSYAEVSDLAHSPRRDFKFPTDMITPLQRHLIETGYSLPFTMKISTVRIA